jgi:drug/metabolite transporter (DMT)-like permease
MLMSQADVSFIWPLTSLGFVATTFAARFVLKEEVSAARWAGVIMIAAGAALISWTEKAKEARVHAEPSPSTTLHSDR